MMATQEQLTPTQERLMAILLDGNAHSAEELWRAVDDELSNRNNLNVHISLLRKRLEPRGLNVVCYERTGKYQLMRRINVPGDDE